MQKTKVSYSARKVEFDALHKPLMIITVKI